MTTHSKKASDLLQSEGQSLQYILTKVKHLQKLQANFNHHIPADMKSSCQIANVLNGKLVLIVSSGTIATQIRFETTALLGKFKDDPLLKDIKQIETKVRPQSQVLTSKSTRSMVPLTTETAELVLDIAEGLEPKIKEILQRIALYKKP